VLPNIGYEMAKALFIKPDSPEPTSESAPQTVPARKKRRKPPRIPAVCSRTWIVVTRLATQWLW
jgi:hypothetical protein